MRGYITGSGWKDYQATGAVCGIELPAGPAGVRAAARADLHAGDEGRASATTTRTIDFDRAAEIVGDRGADGGAARRLDRAVLRSRAEHARERGIILADTKFEFGRRRRRRARARRRGADARLLALLARRRLRAGRAPSRASTSSTCATGPPATRLGQDAARAGAPRRRRRAARARGTSRPTSGSPASRSTRWLERTGAREGARPDPAQGGHPRPAGPGRRARAAGARLRGRRERARRPAGRARRRGPRPARADVREAARQPADRGLRGQLLDGGARA